jgi:hypothetical protein
VDALFDYLTTVAHTDPQAARQALLADYLHSGARASPKALQALLHQRATPGGKPVRALVPRQERHAGPSKIEA